MHNNLYYFIDHMLNRNVLRSSLKIYSKIPHVKVTIQNLKHPASSVLSIKPTIMIIM